MPAITCQSRWLLSITTIDMFLGCDVIAFSRSRARRGALAKNALASHAGHPRRRHFQESLSRR